MARDNCSSVHSGCRERRATRRVSRATRSSPRLTCHFSSAVISRNRRIWIGCKGSRVIWIAECGLRGGFFNSQFTVQKRLRPARFRGSAAADEDGDVGHGRAAMRRRWQKGDGRWEMQQSLRDLRSWLLQHAARGVQPDSPHERNLSVGRIICVMEASSVIPSHTGERNESPLNASEAVPESVEPGNCPFGAK